MLDTFVNYSFSYIGKFPFLISNSVLILILTNNKVQFNGESNVEVKAHEKSVVKFKIKFIIKANVSKYSIINIKQFSYVAIYLHLEIRATMLLANMKQVLKFYDIE